MKELEKYILYLNFIQKKLDEFFKEQSPYIHCKEGCSHCCEKGEYPYSEVEFTYLMVGVQSLPQETVSLIEANIEELRNQKSKLKPDEQFMHACPFLINHRCSLYQYRGLICRSHGLAFFSKTNKILVPACSDIGLNYAEVYDTETNTISTEMFEKTGYNQEPLAHNVGLHFLTHNSMTESLNLDFGEIKPMSYWLEL